MGIRTHLNSDSRNILIYATGGGGENLVDHEERFCRWVAEHKSERGGQFAAFSGFRPLS